LTSPRSTIHPSFKHGKSFTIGQFSVVEENVKAGDDVSIGHSCVLKSGTRIGDDVKIGDNVVIGILSVEQARHALHNYSFSSPKKFEKR